MPLRKRRNMPVGSPSRAPAPHNRVGDGHGTRSSLKFVLLACAIALVLLVFAVSWMREAAGSCHLCLRGDGTVREFQDGDGGLQKLGFAEEDDGEVGRTISHPQICSRLYHEKQISRLDLIHALNNLMQVLSYGSINLTLLMLRQFLRRHDSRRSVSEYSQRRKQNAYANVGNDRFTREEMDHLAERVQDMASSFKKHFDVSTGNYDAEVLKAAAASRAKAVVLYAAVEELETITLSGRDDLLVGLILHLKRRLWIAIRQYQGLWYNFDSTKAAPLLFCDGVSGLHMFLDKVVDEGGVVVVVLKQPPVAPILLPQRPPPSIKNLEYWKNWLFG